MKASAFENLFRKVVREEIDYALRREIKTLKEDLRDELKPTIVEQQVQPVQRTPIPKNVQSSLKERIMGNSPAQSFTPNGALNDLLNETAQGSTNTETANAPVSLAQPFASGAPLPIDTSGIPEPVANAITRDYSGLMGAILKKKNNN